MKKNNEFRKEFVEKFLNSIENKTYWQQSWNYISGKPKNAFTHRKYSGINSMNLKFIENEKGYGDPRWATFKQIQEAGYRVRKRSKGETVEYFFAYDNVKKIYISWENYNKLDDKYKENCSIHAKYFKVFNGSQIEGLELYVTFERRINPGKLVEQISYSLNVPIINRNNSARAFYDINKDEIVMPVIGQFEDSYSYNAVALHELSHATGHEKRLNRDIINKFGTQKYAYEELVAEFSSCFLSMYSKDIMSAEHFNNHNAYLKHWAEQIKKDNNYLFKVIKDAEKAADYIIEKAGLENMLEKEQILENDKELEKLEKELDKELKNKGINKSIDEIAI